MNKVELKIFFDESNYKNSKIKKNKKDYSKDKDDSSNVKIDLMGGLSIPKKVYSTEGFKNLNKSLRKNEYNIHWTRYSGDSNDRKRIKKMIFELVKFYRLIDLNIIYKEADNNTGIVNNDEIKDMMYYKFPERIIYGLLRGYNIHTKIDAKIYIEDATEYKDINLKENTVRNLKRQSIYRGQNFKISKENFKYVDCRENFNNLTKDVQKEILSNREIGIYMIDVLLGIVRIIIENHYGENISNTVRSKNEIILQLLAQDDFYNFLKDIKIFYWNYNKDLKQIEFEKYIKLFLSNQDLWIKYLSMNKDQSVAKLYT